LAKDEQC